MLAQPPRPGSTLSGLAVPAGLGIVLGLVMPLSWGFGLPVLVLFGAWLLTVGRDREIRAALAGAGGWPAFLAARPIRERLLLGAVVGLAGVVFAAVAVRAVGGLLMAFPGAAWAVGAVVLLGLLAAVVPRLGGPRAALAGALLVPVLASMGARWEAEAPDARGWAHSGPLLGIHPFQITSVLVDGEGPYDLPINDYIEPDGGRGYGAPELAEALELALHQIAEKHYPDGPERKRRAFLDARVEHRVTPGVRERLDREPEFELQPRFLVTSGTYGPRSRVEFICPGTRNDPRPREPDPVMTKMCADKYAAEASAGMGVTGRWAGYTEARGNERFGLARLVGATRSDDEHGETVERWELRVWGFLLLALAGVASFVRGGAPGRAVSSIAGTTALLTIAFAAASALGWMGSARIGLVEPAAPWAEPLRAGAWVAALIPAMGIVHLLGEGRGPSRGGWWIGLAFAPVLLATAWAASHLSSQSWSAPDLWGAPGALPLEDLVVGVAGGLAVHLGAELQVVETIVAAVLATICLGLACASVRLSADTLPATLTEPKAGISLAGVLVVVVGAACLVLSRKTGGGAALLWSAVAGTLVVGSALWAAVRSGPATAVSHLLWVAVGATLVVEPFLANVDPSPLLLAGGGAGFVAVFGSLVVLFGGGPPGGAKSAGKPAKSSG